ncbi:conserved hypothetical protein [Rubrivivax sp. A210]|uniref:hypothetical protein n=1 Tax=Rubrivivax sp. A210 TaxID=2772301 RepID=UPI001917B9E1|nr:hypothetical protein [Rubrivivax sp. A210]CAD5369302.1 conserved hypothetical protein [Rubrivivax sp. A210]
MHPPDTAADGQAAWIRFVGELTELLAEIWPAMPRRLGDRYAAFVELAAQQAEKRGLARAGAVARYVNLCIVWGPGFQDKPGFEWAAGLLAAPPERGWNTAHQLVRRSVAELGKRNDARIAPAALAAADEQLVARFGGLGSRGELLPPTPVPAPLRACDFEGLELRLLEPAVAQRYVLQGGEWLRADIPLPPPLRIDAARPLPPLVAVLSRPPRQQPAARLQLRARAHAVCDGDLHPAVEYMGAHGLWRWQGHETQAFSWPVQAAEPGPPLAPPGVALAAETSPDIARLVLETCGLRDEGDALGAMNTLVWVWPSDQWWVELQRAAPAARTEIGAAAAEPARLATRCRVECDGQALDTAALRAGFEQGLDGACAQALQKLLAAWTALPGLSTPRLEGSLALLSGRAALSWGWSLGAGGMEGRAFLRLLAEMRMQAIQADVQLEGEIAHAGARARLRLRCVAAAPLELSLAREAAEPPLLAAMVAATVRFRLPFEAEVVPLAGDSGGVLQVADVCSGALVGEAGLRPRVMGGGGFEWFAALRVEAVKLPLLLEDPLLGRHTLEQLLLPEATLMDWALR